MTSWSWPRIGGTGSLSSMLTHVEAEARNRGACKLTLEVLSGNHSALRAYEREGFANYQLDPAFGTAVFLEKKLAPRLAHFV